MRLIDVLILIIIFSDEEFRDLKKCRPDVFLKLYTEYRDVVYSFLVLRCKGNEAAAEDILSDTFESAMLSVPKLSSQINICSWLMNIAYRRMCDYFKRSRRDSNIIESMKHSLHDTPDAADEVIEGMEKDHRFFLIRTAMEQIQPVYKEVMLLKYVEELSQKEIARKTGKSEGTVGVILTRARKALRKKIASLDNSYFGEDIR